MRSKTIFPGSKIILKSDDKTTPLQNAIVFDVNIKINLFSNCLKPSYRFLINTIINGEPGSININTYTKNPYFGYYGLTLNNNFIDFGKYFINNNKDITEKEFINYIKELLRLENLVQERNDKKLMEFLSNMSINTYGIDIFKK